MSIVAARQAQIMALVGREGHIDVNEAAIELGVSTITIRRDLAALAQKGRLERVHGGAVLARAIPERGNNQYRVGMLIPTLNYYYRAVFEGAEHAALAAGIKLIYGAHNYFGDVENERFDRLLEMDVQAIIVASTYGSDQSELFRRIDNSPVPVVLCERSWSLPQLTRARDVARSDHRYGAFAGLHHLWSLGHRKVVWASAATANSDTLSEAISDAADLLDGIELTNLGVTYLPHEIRGVNAVNDRILDEVESAGATAVFIHNDLYATMFLEHALLRRIEVPATLSVLSYDDETAKNATVPLTAVAPPKREVGALATELVVQRMQCPESPIRNVALSPQIIERSSTSARGSAPV